MSFYSRGEDYDSKGDYDRAIRDYDEAARLNPTNYRTFEVQALDASGRVIGTSRPVSAG